MIHLKGRVTTERSSWDPEVLIYYVDGLELGPELMYAVQLSLNRLPRAGEEIDVTIGATDADTQDR